MHDYLDERDIPDRTVNMNLDEFYDVARDLLRDENKQPDFVTLMMTGRLPNNVQVAIQPLGHAVRPNDPFYLSRDIDSAIGISEHIQFDHALTLYPVAKIEDTLVKDIHISHTFETDEGAFTLPVHKVPNICLGKASDHSLIRVLLPGLYSPNRTSSVLTQAEQADFYESGFRPAMAWLFDANETPASINEWPNNYANEMWRARGLSGTLAFQTKTCPHYFASGIADNIRQCLRNAGHAQMAAGLLILHQIRGVKHVYIHQMTHEAAEAKFWSFCTDNGLDPDTFFNEGRWWLDIGLEIASNVLDDFCLSWRTDAHYHVLRHVAGLPHEQAHRITKVGSSKYTRDMTTHLSAVSGCRIAPGPRARGPYGLSYFQLYGTDKSIIYRPDRNFTGKAMTVSLYLKGGAEKWLDCCYANYLGAIELNNASARVEARVEARYYLNVLLDFPRDLIRQSVVCINPVVFWGIRAHRVLAANLLLQWQKEGNSSDRTRNSALLLTAATVWMVNGVHSTPDKGPASRDLLLNTLIHVERQDANPDHIAFGTPTDDDDVASDLSDDEDQDAVARRFPQIETLPAYPYGMLFFRPIHVGHPYPVPRFLTRSQFITAKSFKFFFGNTMDEIKHDYFQVVGVQPAHPRRVQNKTRQTRTYVNFELDPDVPEPPLFNVPNARPIPRPTQDPGSDMDLDEDEEPFEDDPNRALTKLWHQFISDIISKVPNQESASKPSWMLLSNEERDRATETLFKDLHLDRIWLHFRWKSSTVADWDRTFGHVFPDRDQELRSGKIQNYATCKWWAQWNENFVLNTNLSRADFNKFRNQIKRRFDKLSWFPYTQTDRIWYTKGSRNKLNRSPGLEEVGTAPWIMIHGNRKPIPSADDN